MSLNTAINKAKEQMGNKSVRIEQLDGGYTCDHSNMGDYGNDKKHVMKTHSEVAKHVKEHFAPASGAGKEKK